MIIFEAYSHGSSFLGTLPKHLHCLSSIPMFQSSGLVVDELLQFTQYNSVFYNLLSSLGTARSDIREYERSPDSGFPVGIL